MPHPSPRPRAVPDNDILQVGLYVPSGYQADMSSWQSLAKSVSEIISFARIFPNRDHHVGLWPPREDAIPGKPLRSRKTSLQKSAAAVAISDTRTVFVGRPLGQHNSVIARLQGSRGNLNPIRCRRLFCSRGSFPIRDHHVGLRPPRDDAIPGKPLCNRKTSLRRSEATVAISYTKAAQTNAPSPTPRSVPDNDTTT